jgi:phosphoglycolate phosphatase-like HAD superfamily hydrolase
MIRLAEEVEKRGDSPQDPLYYKKIYHNLLMNHINDRLEGLRNGSFQPNEWMVPGSFAVLENLNKFKISCFLASGTDKEYVLDEADLLGVTNFFQRIYGAVDDYKSFSKEMVIKRIIAENNLTGPELVAFGDGYVEIKNTKSVNGIAIGLATNEAERQGVDEWKRERLISSGADIIMPDFQQYQILIEYLWEEE